MQYPAFAAASRTRRRMNQQRAHQHGVTLPGKTANRRLCLTRSKRCFNTHQAIQMRAGQHLQRPVIITAVINMQSHGKQLLQQHKRSLHIKLPLFF